jgi:hypothetical protein
MTPHPRIRKTIKWGGAAVTVLLVVVWISLSSIPARPVPKEPGDPFLVLVGAFTLATVAAWRYDAEACKREQAHLCPKCNYDRTGIANDAVCPECGSKGGPA